MNTENKKPPIIVLMADDDEDDRMLAKAAFEDCRPTNDLRFVADGEELIDYLFRRGAYAPPADAPLPNMILLDLNMPRKSGLECLKEIRAAPHLRQIPVIILTTSSAEEDVLSSYDLGANSYICKPTQFMELIKIVSSLSDYWFDVSQLPNKQSK